MDIKSLLTRYFSSETSNSSPTIDVFDADTIYMVYQRVVGLLTEHLEIETSMLQAMSYCFYEVLDNVLTHSGKVLGTVLTDYDNVQHTLRILVADDGIGVQKSLIQEPKYQSFTEEQALLVCVQDSVTDGKGMGFGLYSTSLLAKNLAIQFEIHSGTHKLILENQTLVVKDTDSWKGTLVFLELHTNKEIDPSAVVANRTDCATQYNEAFLDNPQIEDLW